MKKALAMALAIMCVLALAGCGTNPAKEVLPWMQNLKADDISEVQVWNMSTAEDLKKVLTKEETAELVAVRRPVTIRTARYRCALHRQLYPYHSQGLIREAHCYPGNHPQSARSAMRQVRPFLP